MEPRIAEFLAGELAKRSEVEEHLLVCSDCRARFSSAKAGWDAAGEWTASDPSPDAIQSVLSNLPAAAPRRKLLRVFQAGTLAASLFISALIGSSQRSGTPREAPARPAAARPASIGLASVRPSVGLLYVQDENGRPAGELSIRSLDVRVDIQDGVARTEIEEIFENRTDRRLEGTFLFPLPPDASISRLAMEIGGKLMEGEVVERRKARETYEGIVRRMNDPALLEWMPGGLFKCRIFPIESRSDKRIIIAYTQALSAFDGRATYVYPLAGDSAGGMGIGRFSLEATVRAGGRLLHAESTSHDAASTRVDDRTIRTTFSAAAFHPKADFVIACETELAGEVQLSAHRPDASAPGYFAVFITPRPDADEGYRRDRRLFFLIDASGSVTRPELEAARTVVRRMIESLAPADRFRIGSHNDLVDSMEDFVAPDAAGKTAANRFLGAIEPIGAGDPATSLERVLPLVPDDGEVVYIGEGTPTWGEKDPAKIVARLRKVVKDRGVSIRTVAVGSGADRGLLETLAREFNGGAHTISPSDDVRSRADEIARTLGRSAVNDLKVEFKGPVTDAAPARLGSLHFGERLLVTGRYGAGPVKLILTGKVFDRLIRREFALALPERESGNLHVKRLWAQRLLADLVAEGEAKKAEAITLSVEHQVMTPYTSFLVLESEKAYEDFRIERTKKETEQAAQPAPAPGPAGDHYDLACKYYDSGDFERAEAECDKILKEKPDHGPANALKLELNYALGKRRLPPDSPETEKIIVAARARQEQVNLEVRNKLETGIRSYNQGNYADAERDFRTVLEYAKWLPKGVDLDAQRKQAAELLERVRTATPRDDSSTAETQRGGIAFTVGEGRQSAARGKPLDSPTDMDFITFPVQRPSTFPDPGYGEDFGSLGLPPYDAQKGSHYRVLRSNRLPLMNGPAPADLRVDGYYAERHQGLNSWLGHQKDPFLGDLPTIDFLFDKSRSLDGGPYIPDIDVQVATAAAAADPLPPSVFGLNVSVAIPGDKLSLTLLDLLAGGSEVGPGFVNSERPLLRKVQGLNDLGDAVIPYSDTVVFPTAAEWAEISKRVEESRTGLAQANSQRLTAVQDLQYLRQELERATRVPGSKPPEELVQRITQLTRIVEDQEAANRTSKEELVRLQEVIANLNGSTRTDGITPRNAMTGRVTSFVREHDLVVISMGRDAGVNEGDTFTVTRGTTFVGKIVIDSVDGPWASGKVVLKGKDEPRVGDDVSNTILAPQTKFMGAIHVAGNEVQLSGAPIDQFGPGSVVVMIRNGAFVAVVRVFDVFGSTARARIATGMQALPVETGDQGFRVKSWAELWATLPYGVRCDLVSRQSVSAAGQKLRILRALKGVTP